MTSCDIENGILFKNVRLIDPATQLDIMGSLLTEGDQIKAINPSSCPKESKIIDGHGAVLCPGFIDLRASLGEPGAEYRETLRTGSQAAVAGGITSIGVIPDTTPTIDTSSLVIFLKECGKKIALTTLYPHASITKDMKGKKLVEMGLLQKAGVRAFTDNQHVISDTKQMRNIMSYSKSLDTLLMLHPQDASLSANSCATAGFFATELGLPQVSTKAEVIAVSRDLNLAAMTGAKIHFSNISTKESLDLIRQAKKDSINVTCDTSPPYFCLNEKAIGNFRTYAKFTPPLRQENDRIAVLEALHDKTIDVVTSSHTPCDTDDKRLPFAHARAGGTGLVTLLGTTLQAGLSLIETIRLLTYNPAQLMNLKIGSLTPGYKADLCLFDPERTWTVRAGKLPGLAQNTPFDDWNIKGYILKTIHHGQEVYNAPS